MKFVLNAIVDRIENLAISLDALEQVLIRKGQLKIGEIEQSTPIPALIVAQHLTEVHLAISRLPE
jgi:hypothetical protein